MIESERSGWGGDRTGADKGGEGIIASVGKLKRRQGNKVRRDYGKRQRRGKGSGGALDRMCGPCVFVCEHESRSDIWRRALMKPFSLYAVMEMAVFRLPGCAGMPIGCTGDDSSPPSIATVTKRELWRWNIWFGSRYRATSWLDGLGQKIGWEIKWYR